MKMILLLILSIFTFSNTAFSKESCFKISFPEENILQRVKSLSSELQSIAFNYEEYLGESLEYYSENCSENEKTDSCEAIDILLNMHARHYYRTPKKEHIGLESNKLCPEGTYIILPPNEIAAVRG